MIKKLFKLMYAPDGGGAGGTAGGQAGGGEGVGQPGVNEGASVAGESRQRGRNALQSVVYGKQPQTQEQGNGQDAAAQDGESKQGKTYTDQDLQRIIGQRVGKMNTELQSHKKTIESQKPVMDLLMRRYGLQDTSGLMEALSNDEGLWQAEAARKGKAWEDVRDETAQATRVEALQKRVEELENQEKVNQKIAAWEQEAESLKATFPDFNIEKEFENEEFTKLLQMNVPMATAYKVLHMDDIMHNAVTYAAQTTAKATADTIRARGMRPTENGMASTAGVLAKPDVNTWTKKDREAAEKQARMGIKVYL
jgi:hypothetical protein